MGVIKAIKRFFAPKKSGKPKHPVRFGRKLLHLLILLLGWVGLAVVYYAVFSSLVNTPVESLMQERLAGLRAEYDSLAGRYALVDSVVHNVADRERHLYRSMFDSYPLDESGGEGPDGYVRMSDMRLAASLAAGTESMASFMADREREWEALLARIDERGADAMNGIPSIQPVTNRDMTSIATSVGLRLHPFYKTMVMHNGIDYIVPEGTRIFATADGTVSDVRTTRTSTGVSITVTHPGGYETCYNNLSRALVRRGGRVRRGDIIALSGNTGLSLAPHLHYEVRLGGEPVDPVHYFFYETGPYDYDRVRKAASVGMQTLD